jgi:hypothetical protein
MKKRLILAIITATSIASGVWIAVSRSTDPEYSRSGYSTEEVKASMQKTLEGGRLVLECSKTGDVSLCDRANQIREGDAVGKAILKQSNDRKRAKLSQSMETTIHLYKSYARQCERMNRDSVPCLMAEDYAERIKLFKRELADIED